MAEINNVIAEASQDLQTIEDFVNLPADSDVFPRLLPSVNVGTLAGARQAIFEAGGLPATPFATEALMTASALVDGDYAQVTDDTTNNGLYIKTAGSWVKSAYDPLTQAKSYTDDVLPKYYINDWDKDAAVLGNLGSTGNIVPSSSIYVSGFIGAEAGFSYTASVGDIGVQTANSKVAFYDANQVFIAGSLSEHELTTGQSYTSVAPVGAAYRRYAVSQSARDLFLVTYGTEVISPEDIGKYYDLGFLGGTDAPAIPEDSITEDYIADKAVRLAALADDVLPKYYKNEWDKDAVVLGNLGSTGNLTPSTSVYVSDFIETEAGASYTASVGDIGVQMAVSKAVFYDADKVFISGGYSEHVLSSGQSYTVVAPAGAAYQRHTVEQSAREVFLVTYGTEVISPDDIGKYYDLGLLGLTGAPAIPEQSITGDYIAPKAVALSALADEVLPTVYKNEWDKHTVPLGNFSLTTGNLASSTTVYVTGLIPVKAGQVFTFSQGEIEGGIGNNVRVGFYTTGEVWISGTDNGLYVGGSFTKTVPQDGFMRVSVGQGSRATLMVNVGSTPLTEDQIGELANFGLFDDIDKPLLRPKSVTARYIANGAIGEDELDANLLAKFNEGGGGYVPRKYPNPPTIPFVEVGVSNDEAYWLSEDGEVLYLRNFFQLKQSMDDLSTPAVNIGAPFAKQVRGVRLLPDGQLLVTTARDNTDETNAQVWKSDNYDRNSPADTTFRLVHTAIGDYAEFYNHWGIDCYQNIVVLCEYGTKQGLGARRVYLSQDSGETFSLIFYQEDVFSDLGIPYDEASAHTHTAAYDPWFNRIWVVSGDGINTGTFYSDDLGSTWQVVAGSTGLSAVQYTGIIALADCVVFGSDRAPNGLHIFERTLNRSDPVTIKPWSIVDSFSTTSKIFQMPFRRALGEPVYFGSHHDNRVGDGYAVVMSFVDKYSVTLAYELPFLYTEAIGNLGMQHVIGATAQGNIFTMYYDGSQRITLKGQAPIWS